MSFFHLDTPKCDRILLYENNFVVGEKPNR